MRRSRTDNNFKFFFGGNSIMNLIHQKIKQKERAASAFALVALDCGLPREELFRTLLHLALPRIGIRGVNLGKDSERELFENPFATALIDPAIVVRRAPPHLANFHRRALRLLASLPFGLRAAEEIANAIVVSCGEDAAHHDIKVAVSANEDEAHACFACLFSNARAFLLVHEVGIKNDVAALLHDFDGRVLGDCARFLVAFALFAKLNTNVIALDDRRTDVFGKLMRHRTLAGTNEADDGNYDRLIGLALPDVELRHERILRGAFFLGECFAFVYHNSNYTRQNELCQLSEHLTPPFLGLISRKKMATYHLSFCHYDSIKQIISQVFGFLHYLIWIKNFSFPQNQNMVRADVFLRVLLRFLSVRLRRIFRIFSRGDFLAAAGGESGSD